MVCCMSACENLRAYDDVQKMRRLLEDAAQASGLTMIRSDAHKFEPQGISGFVYLEESHISVHAYPELGYVAFDVFTCGESSPEKALEFFSKAIGAGWHKTTVISRGIHMPTSKILKNSVDTYTHNVSVSKMLSSVVLV